MGLPQENEVQVRVSAETSALKPGMDASAQEVERASERMRQSVSGLKDAISGHMTQMAGGVKAANDSIVGEFESMAGAFSKVGAVIGVAFAAIAGGKLAQMAAETADYTEEAMSLGRAMGTTATQAGIWIEVAKELGSSTSEVEAAAKGLTRNLRENESDLNRLGLVTRDANGNLLDMDTLMKGAIATVNSHKEGTDRNMAAQEVFGRAISGNSKLLLANAEAFKQDEEYIRSLGGQVSGEAVAAWELYDAAMDKIGMAMTAMRNAIGNEVMPVFAKLAEWLSAAMPAAITIAKGALGGLVSAFWLVKNGVTVVWETINAMVVSVAEPIRALATAIGKAITGDFSGAAAEIKGIGGNISAAWSQAFDEMAKSSEETSQRIAAIFGNPTDVEKGAAGGREYAGKPEKQQKEKKEKADKVESRMAEWEAALSQQKAAYMLSHDMYEMSLVDEKKYWDNLLATLDKGAKEYGAVRKKSADLELRILKEKANQSRALAQEEIEEWKRAATDGVNVQQQAAEQQFALGLISKQDMLAQEQAFELERYEIARQAVEERMELLAQDPNMNPVEYQKLKDKLLDIDRKHAFDRQAIENKIKLDQAIPALNVFKSMESSFANAITGMITRAQTLRQALGNIFSAIANSFVTEMVAKPVAEWAMGLLRQTTLYQTFFGVKKSMEVADAATQMATQKTLGITGVMSNAALAASAAMASVAAIPFYGWAMAPEVGAATYGMAMGYLPSAEGGWDIPAGATGLMRYHEREMMLPAKQADVIRDLADGGVGGGAVSIYSRSDDDVIRTGDLKKLLRQMGRNFVDVKR